MQVIKEKNVLVYAGEALTGDNLTPVKNALVEIKDGIISNITPGGSTPPAGALDCSRLALVPGPVDCHVHLALDGVDFVQCSRHWEYPDRVRELIQASTAGHLGSGITAVRDGGERKALAYNFKRENSPAIYIKSPAIALRKKDRYGSFLGAGLEKGQAGEAVAHLASRGADHVKVLASGLVSFREYGKVGPLQFDLPELQEITRGAKRRGLPVMAHASSNEAVKICAAAGVDSIEHGYFAGRESLRVMAEKGIYWVPTFSPVASQLQNSHLSPAEQDIIRRTVEQHLENLHTARQLGVPLAAGTDAGAPGVPHGASFHRELQYYRQAGLSPAEILRAATVQGAKLAGVPAGLVTGEPPRFIAVDGDPRGDLAVLESPAHIFL